MQLLILGATGKTGSQLVQQALQRGHELTAFVRSPDKISNRPAALRVVEGDPLDAAQLTAALPGHTAVLSALGPSPREAFRPSTLLARAAASTVSAMTTAGVQRLAIASAAVLCPEPGVYFAFFRWLLREHARDLTAMESVVRESGLVWTIARPPRLVDSGDARYASRTDALPPKTRSMSFRALAAFMLDCIEQQTHAGEVVGLGAVHG
jgi:putative NADH-flavin reductase